MGIHSLNGNVMRQGTRESRRSGTKDHVDLLIERGVGSIVHAVRNVLGVPLPDVVGLAGLPRWRFLREVRWSLEGAPNDFFKAVAHGTTIYGVYELDLVTVRELAGREFEVYIAGYGEEHARENSVVVKLPLDLTGYHAILGQYIHEYTDADGRKFYLIYDGSKYPQYRIEKDPTRAKEIAGRIKAVIEREITNVLKEVEPPFVLDPITDTSYDILTVTVKDEKFAYYHHRKHRMIEYRTHGGRLTKPVLVLNEKVWRYVVNMFSKVPNRLIYVYTYPENTL